MQSVSYSNDNRVNSNDTRVISNDSLVISNDTRVNSNDTRVTFYIRHMTRSNTPSHLNRRERRGKEMPLTLAFAHHLTTPQGCTWSRVVSSVMTAISITPLGRKQMF